MIMDVTGVVIVAIKIVEPQPGARNLKSRDAIAPLRPRLRQTVASRLIFWKMNRVLRIPSEAPADNEEVGKLLTEG